MSEITKPTKPWATFYANFSPVTYDEMADRWGGEATMWEAYAAGLMAPTEAQYFEQRLFNPARAFASLVLPATRLVKTDLQAAFEMFKSIETRIAAIETVLSDAGLMGEKAVKLPTGKSAKESK